MIHCIGDSHVYVFSGTDSIGGEDVLPFFKTYRLGPHTAYNIIKRRSLIEQIIAKEVKAGDGIMFCFGEIDCRTQLLKQARLQKKSLRSIVNECVDRYFEIFRIAKQYGVTLLAWNAPPSSREDIQFGEYSTYGNCKQRNNVTRLFNDSLKMKCEESGVIFVSIFDKLIDRDGLTNTSYFLDPIHLSQKAMPLILDELRHKGVIPQRGNRIDTAAQKTVAINIVYDHFQKESPTSLHRGGVSVVWSAVPLEGFDVYAYVNSCSFRGKQSGLDVLIMLEPIVVLPGEYHEDVWKHFDYVFSLCDALSEYGHKFKKISFPRSGWPSAWAKQSSITEDAMQRNKAYPLEEKRNAVCMINGCKHSSVQSELYSRRSEIAEWFHNHSDIPFDIFGNPPFALPNYKGALAPDTKLDALRRYRYCLCFENTDHPLFSAGYITEKILDCLESRTVPIYLGSVNIETYIPPECFIDFRQFADYADLNRFLHSLSDGEYRRYIDHIDSWVARGGLRPYSWHTIYTQLAEVHAAKAGSNIRDLFLPESNWAGGISTSFPIKNLTPVTSSPLWTWNDLAGGTSPLLTDAGGSGTALKKDYRLQFQIVKSEQGSLRMEFLKELSDAFGLDTFIETGTYMGDTSYTASKIFQSVHTIELSDELSQKAIERFKNDPHIHVHRGDSGKIFPELLSRINGKFLFWLDGHYSEGITAKGDENTPIIKEIKAIKDAGITDAVLLIDDLRFFDAVWDVIPEHSAARGYPSVSSLCSTILEIDEAYQFAVVGDVFMAYPASVGFAITPVVTACTISRLYDGIRFPLDQVMEAEVTIGKAQETELFALQNLFVTCVHAECYGLSKHYRLWHALILAHHQDYMKACKEFLMAMNLGLDHWRINWYLANAAYRAGYVSLAKSEAEIVSRIVPDFDEARQLLDRVRAGDQHASDKNVFSLQDRLELARHYHGAARYDKALAELEAAGLHHPDSPDIHYGFAKLHAAMGQYKKAIKELRTVLSLNPGCAPAYHDLGEIHMIMGNSNKALENFKKAISLDCRQYDALTNILTILTKNGNFEEAAGTIKPLLDQSPHDIRLLKVAEQFIAAAKKNGRVPAMKEAKLETVQTDPSAAEHGSTLQKPIRNVQVMSGTQISADCRIGDYSYIGYNCFITKSTIGRYCSIANNVSIGQGEHDLNRISTSSLFYEHPYQELTRDACTIGNDVWIGVDAIIKRGVAIGDGAVIGANSFVNTDVPAYAIAAGSPARVVKFRFSQEKIAEIRKSNWWNYELDDAKKIIRALEENTQNEATADRRSLPAEPNRKLAAIAFSKDRAMQLDGTLRSFFLHCNDAERVDLNVLYTTSQDEYERQYQQLAADYPSVSFIREKSFKADLLSLLSDSRDVLFLVDDNIFVRDFHVGHALDALGKNPDAIGFSLRLGGNTHYCYMLKTPQAIPRHETLPHGICRYDWTSAECDFGYPLEVSSSIYRTSDMVPLLKQLDFSNPNTLELALDRSKHLPSVTKKSLLCFKKSVTFCNPVNMVQTMWKNRAGENSSYTPARLAALFDEGYRMDAEQYSSFLPNSCHQEVDIKLFEKESPIREHDETHPLLSILILNYNGLQHLPPCLESIRRNTPEGHEIIVIDNASTDGSFDYLRSRQDIILIENTENLGCPPARAQLLSMARGKYVIFLDNDTVVTKDWAKKFIEYACSDPKIGMIGPRSNYVSGAQLIPDVRYNNVGEMEKFAQEWAARNKGKLTPTHRLIGFCMFITRELINRIGNIDATFGRFGFEDDDYTWRANIAGFKTVIANDVFVHHTGGPQGRGDSSYNHLLMEAWSVFRKKWRLPETLQYGQAVDLKAVFERPFEERHYIPLMDPHALEPLVYRKSPPPNRTVPPDAETGYKAIEELVKEGRYNDAAAEMERLVTTYPDHAAFWNDLGSLHYKLGDRDQSLRNYQKACELDPENAVFQRNLADLYWVEFGNMEEALKLYVTLLNRNPKDIEILLILGNMSYARRQFDDALNFYQNVLELDASNANAREGINTLKATAPDHAEPPGINEIQEERSDPEGNGADAVHCRVEPVAKYPTVSGLTSIILYDIRNLEQLKGCLDRVKQSTPEPHEVIVADNNCPAEVRKWLKKRIKTAKNCRYVAGGNPCLAEAINGGIRASSGEVVVLLSSDVMVSEHWLPDLIACLNRTPAVGIVGPMMNAGQGKQKVQIPRELSLEQLSDFCGRFREQYRHRRIPARTVSGYCMMFKRDLTDRLGIFDENPFFGSYSFEDYCVRAKLDGYRICLCGDVYVHVSGRPHGPEEGSRKAFQEKWSIVDKENPIAEKIRGQMLLEASDHLILQGKTDQAVHMLIQGIGQLPGVRDLYYSLAELLLENKRYQDAIGAMNAMPADETDARQFEIVGSCQEGLGLDHDAEQSADRALSLANSARAYNLKGVLSYKRGDLERAEAYFQKAMDCDPGYGEPCTNTGVLRWSMGQKHDGLGWMERGLILSPHIHDGADRYYSALADLGQYERGERLLRETKNVCPSKKIIFLLIDSLLRQGKFKEAMDEAEDAILSFGLEEGMLEAALAIRSKIGPKTVDKGNGRPSLSLCMIVKDEEENLPRCLSSVKRIVDEIIVVDTGSGDQSRNIARAFGAKLYEYAWTNSFSEARNYSLDQAEGDWILLLDADEVISELDHDDLLSTIRMNDRKKAFAITTRNYLEHVAVEGWTPNEERYYREAAGCGWMPSEKCRIFPNLKNIRFENPVHEFIEASLRTAGIHVKKTSVAIHHYGKLNREKMRAKEETYYQLGIQKLKEKGNDLKALIEIAIQAAEAGKYDEALRWWEKVIEINPDESIAYYNMGSIYLVLGRYAEAIDASKKSLAIHPHRKEALTNLAFGEIVGGDVRNAIRILEGMINGKVEYPIANVLLAIAYCIDDKADAGLKYISGLKKNHFHYTPIMLDTSQRLTGEGRNDDAIRLLKTLVDGGCADHELAQHYGQSMQKN